MDNSHVALVSMLLRSESFSPYRCDRNIALGINLGSLTKVLRAAQGDDQLTLKAEDAPDVVNLVFESSGSDRISEYDIKLMDIDQEHLGIPETDYAATITMPAAEFQRICRDLTALSESGTLLKLEAISFRRPYVACADLGCARRACVAMDLPGGPISVRQCTHCGTPGATLLHDIGMWWQLLTRVQSVLSAQKTESSSPARATLAPGPFTSGSTTASTSRMKRSRLT